MELAEEQTWTEEKVNHSRLTWAVSGSEQLHFIRTLAQCRASRKPPSLC